MVESPSFTFRLPPDLKDFIDKQIENGEGKDYSDYFYRLVLKDKIRKESIQNVQEIVDRAFEKKFYSADTVTFIKKIIENTNHKK